MSPDSGRLAQERYSSAVDYVLTIQYSFVIQHVKHINDRLFTRIKKWWQMYKKQNAGIRIHQFRPIFIQFLLWPTNFQCPSQIWHLVTTKAHVAWHMNERAAMLYPQTPHDTKIRCLACSNIVFSRHTSTSPTTWIVMLTNWMIVYTVTAR